ncbi:hypothetical protein LTR66_000082 [Elasticomyces elasticus]|nr:hypothetical protein LTR66_000082 [Elasticomyces elasticus]KAK5011559.1 hypothetical protein LTR28_013614 [Elasticomyces elasticus]
MELPGNGADSLDRFMRDRTADAPNVVTVETDCTAVYSALGNSAVSWAVKGMCGCTSLIVVSERAVYFTHYYENLAFCSGIEGVPIKFKKLVLDALENGNEHQESLRGHATDFRDQRGLAAFIMTPTEEDGVKLDYRKRVKQLKEKVNDIIGITPEVVPYKPIDCTDEDVLGTNALGTALFQFDPRQNEMDPRALSKVWIERREVYSHAWTTPGSLSTPSSPPGPQISQTCFGTGTTKYVSQSVLAGNIKDYCSQAAKQGVQDPGSGSLSRDFNKDTPEHVYITMTWPSGSAFVLSEADCNHYLGDLIMNGCDGNDGNNPMNWKHGGTVQVDKVEYKIEPEKSRPTAPQTPGGSCDAQWKVALDSFTVMGQGWATADYGKGLKDNLNGCGGSAYDFKYETGTDGHEWTLTGKTPVFKKNCIQDAIKSAGGPALSCSGSG